MGRKSLPCVTPEASKLSLVFIIIFTLLSFLNSSCCKASSPSSCGSIKNISCPFTLQGDNQKCDASFFIHELSCINNRTVLYLLPDRLLFYVESINYDNLTMRIVDPGLQKNNYSSLPSHSITGDAFPSQTKYFLDDFNQPITTIECPSPVKSTRYMNITSPNSYTFSASVMGKNYVYSYAYIVAGKLDVAEIEDNCRINKVAWVSDSVPYWSSYVFSNMSEIHNALVYGFEFPWNYFYCLNCKAYLTGTGYCDAWNMMDHHLWSCITFSDSPSCNLHDSSYHLSVSCFRQNWNGIMDQFRLGKIREDIGKIFLFSLLLSFPFLSHI